jgi:alpha-ketoglutarate-dependent taurine dioxygenase
MAGMSQDPATAHRGIARGEPVLPLPEWQRGGRVLEQPVGSPRAWVRADVRPGQWLVPLPDAAVAEVLAMAGAMRRAPLPLLLRHPDEFDLAACREAMARVRELLTEGMGMAVLERLPMDRLEADEAIACFWVLGQLLATPVATRWDGTMLYDVRDTGRRFGYGVRGSATNVELSFHTDNAFGVALPDYVGLLCVQPALSGGVSRFCSLNAAHDEMLRAHPDLLRRLYRPAYYDRQAEHAPGAPRVLSAPLFDYDGRSLRARLTPNLVRRGYEMVDEPMDAELAEALACLEAILGREDRWVELALERGQVQYVNNLDCAHYRSAFTDSDDPARRRHLVRVWYRLRGGRAYDG